MKVLLTGAFGFVGLETWNLLEAKGLEVIPYDLMNNRDIRDYTQLDYICRTYGIERILHLAAVARFADADKDPKLTFETNVLGTRKIVEVAKKYKIPVVYASTGSVYMPVNQEPPITEDFETKGNSVYGCTKYMGELYVKEHTPHIILRYAHLYGKEKRGHGLIGGFWSRIQRGLKPELYGGKQSNDFTYIKDVAMANFKALTAPWSSWNQVYNIGTGEELTAKEAGKMICDITGWKEGIDIKKGREVDPQRFVYSIDKAKTMLGYDPKYKFKDGLEEMFGGEKNEETISKSMG